MVGFAGGGGGVGGGGDVSGGVGGGGGTAATVATATAATAAAAAVATASAAIFRAFSDSSRCHFAVQHFAKSMYQGTKGINSIKRSVDKNVENIIRNADSDFLVQLWKQLLDDKS